MYATAEGTFIALTIFLIGKPSGILQKRNPYQDTDFLSTLLTGVI